MGKAAEHECGSCGELMSGYTRAELEEDGWVWNLIQKKGVATTAFVMCDSCEAKYAQRRKANA